MKSEFETSDGRVSLPARWCVCPECDGSGTELGHGLKGAVISDEVLADDDFREHYFSGAFDVPCSRCRGRTTIAVMDVRLMTVAERRLAVEVRRAERAKREAEAERQWLRSLRERGIEY